MNAVTGGSARDMAVTIATQVRHKADVNPPRSGMPRILFELGRLLLLRTGRWSNSVRASAKAHESPAPGATTFVLTQGERALNARPAGRIATPEAGNSARRMAPGARYGCGGLVSTNWPTSIRLVRKPAEQ